MRPPSGLALPDRTTYPGWDLQRKCSVALSVMRISGRRVVKASGLEKDMAFAKARIGAANYAASIMAGHHQLLADEGLKLGGKGVGPAPSELLRSAAAACTAITLRMCAEREDGCCAGRLSTCSLSGRIRRRDHTRAEFRGRAGRRAAGAIVGYRRMHAMTLTLKQGIEITATVALCRGVYPRDAGDAMLAISSERGHASSETTFFT
jgi:putative redox protein